ncbi:sulfite oxidase-like oxidoreductase [Azospirillum sp.]|uniref:sulfite oxidase-like oxidoreductase n=1 Tax=Azospirillum sp. TaxID=34012 RepID=UPI003D74FC7B
MDETDHDGEPDAKLIAAKERWAREARGLTGAPGTERLPPGQHRTEGWPVLDLGILPRVDRSNWQLTVDGLVENPVTWRWDDLQAQPVFRHVSDIHCVTSWSRYDNHWEGVSARHLLSVVRPAPEARFVLFHSSDGYTTNLPLFVFDDEDVLLATSWEGEPIDRDHGGPVRVVVPKRYFWKSAKWVRRIEFLAEDKRGYWEVRGYHNDADPWKEERYGE